MVSQINAIYQMFRFLKRRSDGAKFETKLINGMLVVCQPAKVKIDGTPLMCSLCKRINDALLVPEHDPRQLELPLPSGMVRFEQGTWYCSCIKPLSAIGNKTCLRCDLPIARKSDGKEG